MTKKNDNAASKAIEASANAQAAKVGVSPDSMEFVEMVKSANQAVVDRLMGEAFDLCKKLCTRSYTSQAEQVKDMERIGTLAYRVQAIRRAGEVMDEMAMEKYQGGGQ